MAAGMGKLWAPHRSTDRLYDSLLAGPSPVPDVVLPHVDTARVPELVELIDERVADLRALRHQLVTLTATEADTIACGRCGTDFLPRRAGQVYCSNACRQAAHRNGKDA